MEIKVKLNYLRISPRKVRLMVNTIRGKNVKEAQAILRFTVKKSARPILKLLDSAIASAKNSFQKEENNLYIKKITVDEGPSLKRWLPRARGQADVIKKRTSHITLVLGEREAKGVEKAVAKTEKEVKESKKPKEHIEAPEREKEKKEKKLVYKIGNKKVLPRQEIRPKRFFRRKAF